MKDLYQKVNEINSYRDLFTIKKETIDQAMAMDKIQDIETLKELDILYLDENPLGEKND